jgi:hypothetical protein
MKYLTSLTIILAKTYLTIYKMPREGEPPKAAKLALNQLCKIRIVKPVPKENKSRPTARHFWGCDEPNCNRTYTLQ